MVTGLMTRAKVSPKGRLARQSERKPTIHSHQSCYARGLKIGGAFAKPRNRNPEEQSGLNPLHAATFHEINATVPFDPDGQLAGRRPINYQALDVVTWHTSRSIGHGLNGTVPMP